MTANAIRMPEGYCYLTWFEEAGCDIDRLRCLARQFGPCPNLRRVLAYLYQHFSCKDYFSGLSITGNLAHVDPKLPKMDIFVMMYIARDSILRVGSTRTFDVMSLTSALKLSPSSILEEAARNELSRPYETALLAEIKEAVLSETSEMWRNRGGKKVVVRIDIDPTSLVAVRRRFPELKLTASQTVQSHTHALAAVHRQCEEALMHYLAQYSPDVTPKGYDVFAADIGGNFAKHMEGGRYNIHSCSPCLDAKDAKRYSDRVNTIDMFWEKNKKKLRKKFPDKESLHRIYCTMRGEDCLIKAYILFWLHSAYEMTTTAIADCFDSHNSQFGYSAMIFTPDMMVANSGEIPALGCKWERVDGGENIEFRFANDAAWVYVHNFKTYISKVINPVYHSSSGTVIFSEIVSNRGGVLIFKYTKNKSAFIPTSKLTMKLDLPNLSNITLVTFYRRSPYNCSRMRSRAWTTTKFTVSTATLNMIMTYAGSLPQGKFSYQCITEYAASVIRRVVINCDEVVDKSSGLLPNELDMVAGYVYITYYQSRWETGQLMKKIISDIDYERHMAEAGALDYVKQKVKDAVDATCQLGGRMAEVLVMDDYYDWYFGMLKSAIMAIHKCKEPGMHKNVRACLPVQTITIDALVHSYMDGAADYDAAVHRAVCSKFDVDPNSAIFSQEQLDSAFDSKVKESISEYLGKGVSKVSCSEELLRIPCLSKHTCLFDSLAYLSGTTGKELRDMMKVAVKPSDPAYSQLQDGEDGNPVAAGVSVISAFSRLTKTNVCVHTADGTSMDTNLNKFDKTIHVYYTCGPDGGHYEPMVLAQDADRRERHWSVMRRLLYLPEKEYDAIRDRIHPEGTLDKRHRKEYPCNTVHKFAQIVARFHIDVKNKVLLDLCCAPGSTVQPALNLGAQTVYGVTQRRSDELSTCRMGVSYLLPSDKQRCIIMYPQGTGDLLDQKVTDDLCEVFADRRVDIVFADGAVRTGGDVMAVENSDVPLLMAEVSVALGVLKEKGTFILKIRDIFCSNWDRLCHELAPHFFKMVIFKPTTSTKLSGEKYLVCQGFSKISADTELVHLRIRELNAIYEATMATQENAAGQAEAMIGLTFKPKCLAPEAVKLATIHTPWNKGKVAPLNALDDVADYVYCLGNADNYSVEGRRVQELLATSADRAKVPSKQKIWDDTSSDEGFDASRPETPEQASEDHVRVVVGDVFSFKKKDLVHCVSADLKMSAGIAAAIMSKIEEEIPDERDRLRERYNSIEVGDVLVTQLSEHRVYHLVTKAKYHHKPTMGTLRRAVRNLRPMIIDRSVVTCALGAGLDQLDVNSSLEVVHEELIGMDVTVCLTKEMQRRVRPRMFNGLINTGNTCYAATAVQSLLSSPDLTQRVLANAKKSKTAQIIREVRKSMLEKKDTDIESLRKHVLRRRPKAFASPESDAPEDSVDFLLAMLDCIAEEATDDKLQQLYSVHVKNSKTHCCFSDVHSDTPLIEFNITKSESLQDLADKWQNTETHVECTVHKRTNSGVEINQLTRPTNTVIVRLVYDRLHHTERPHITVDDVIEISGHEYAVRAAAIHTTAHWTCDVVYGDNIYHCNDCIVDIRSEFHASPAYVVLVKLGPDAMPDSDTSDSESEVQSMTSDLIEDEIPHIPSKPMTQEPVKLVTTVVKGTFVKPLNKNKTISRHSTYRLLPILTMKDICNTRSVRLINKKLCWGVALSSEWRLMRHDVVMQRGILDLFGYRIPAWLRETMTPVMDTEQRYAEFPIYADVPVETTRDHLKILTEVDAVHVKKERQRPPVPTKTEPVELTPPVPPSLPESGIPDLSDSLHVDKVPFNPSYMRALTRSEMTCKRDYDLYLIPEVGSTEHVPRRVREQTHDYYVSKNDSQGVIVIKYDYEDLSTFETRFRKVLKKTGKSLLLLDCNLNFSKQNDSALTLLDLLNSMGQLLEDSETRLRVHPGSYSDVYNDADISLAKTTVPLEDAHKMSRIAMRKMSGLGRTKCEAALEDYCADRPAYDGTPESFAANAVYEYFEHNRVTTQVIESIHQPLYDQYCKPLLTHAAREAVMKSPKKLAVITLKDNSLVHGQTVSPDDYEACFTSDGVKPLMQAAELYRSGKLEEYALLSDDFVMQNSDRIIKRKSDVRVTPTNVPDVVVVKGVPGCGKSFFIASITKKNTQTRRYDAILAPTREASVNVREMVAQKYGMDPEEQMLLEDIRTLDSFLINNVQKYDRIIIDEGYLSHIGQVYACAVLAGASLIVVVGDSSQINYINRIPQAPIAYSSPDPVADVIQELTLSHRATVSAAAMWSEKYGKFTTSNPTINDMRVVKFTTYSGVEYYSKDTVYLTWKKSERDALHRALCTKCDKKDHDSIVVRTINQYQGRQKKHVVLVRGPSKKDESLYLMDAYLLVGTTRHTKSLTYYTPFPDDKLAKKILAYQNSEPLFPNHYEPVAWKPAAVKPEVAVFPELDMLGKGMAAVYSEFLRIQAREQIMNNPPQILKALHAEKFGKGRMYVKAEMEVELERPADTPTDQLWNILPKWGDPNIRPRVHKIGRYLQCWVDNLMQPHAESESVHQVLQEFYDATFPTHLGHNTKYDSYHVNVVSDVRLNLEYTKFPMTSIFNYRAPAFDMLRPKLRTLMPEKRPNTTIESLMAAAKRNLGVPALAATVDTDSLAKALHLALWDYIDPRKLESWSNVTGTVPLSPNTDMLRDWLSTQPSGTINMADTGQDLGDTCFWFYTFMVKAGLKPGLSDDEPYTYRSAQTVVFSQKDFNAVYNPMWNYMLQEFIAHLDPRFMVYTKMSPDDFAQEMSRRITPKFLKELMKLEGDMSKFDKSQLEAVLKAEILFMLHCKTLPKLAPMWWIAHHHTVVRDRANKITFIIDFQRKSGDPSTYAGNTLFLMESYGVVYPVKEMKFAMFSGDDSVIYSYKQLPDKTSEFSDMLNLECKANFNYKRTYFCSKFLVSDDERFYFVPDPIKLVMKLGRKDLVNFSHLEEYRVSCADLTSVFKDRRCYPELTEAFHERYPHTKKTMNDLSFVWDTLAGVADSKESFYDLFYTEPGDKLCLDPSRPSLD